MIEKGIGCRELIEKKVRFCEKVEVKPATEVDDLKIELSTLENEMQKIREFKSLEEVNQETSHLEHELEVIENRKRNGHDVSEDFDNLKAKFKILIEIKEKILRSQVKHHESKKEIEVQAISNQQETDDKVSKLSRKKGCLKHKSNQDNLPIDKSLKKLKLCDDSMDQKINQKILDSILNRNFQICICFDHQFPFKEDIIDCFKKLEKYNFKVAFLYWTSSKNIFFSEFCEKNELISFENISFKSKNFVDVREEVINIDWSKNAIKLFWYLQSSKDEFENFFYTKKDSTDGLLNYLKISFNKINLKNIDDDFLNLNLLKGKFASLLESKKNFCENLGNLKRIKPIRTQEEMSTYFKDLKIQKETKFDYLNSRNFKQELYGFKNLDEGLEKLDCSVKVYLKKISKDFSIYKNSNLLKAKSSFQDYLFKFSKFSLLSQTNTHFIWIEKILNSSDKIYNNILDINFTCKYFADRFNQESKKYKVFVPDAYLLRSDKETLLAFETTADLKENFTLSKDELAKYILEAFTHYTHKCSNENLIVWDARTFRDSEDAIILTDPIIFSNNQERYAGSNLGQAGIDNFFQNHICNDICQNFFSFF